MDPANADILVECFERVIAHFDEDDVEIFVARVAEEYLIELIRQAHIPIRYIEQLRDDVMCEVQEILKIKSYGSLSFGDYLNQRRTRRRQPSS